MTEFLLPTLSRTLACLENPAREDEEIVKIEGVVFLEHRLISCPHSRGNTVKLIAGTACQVLRCTQFVLGTRDHGPERTWPDEPLANTLVGHSTTQQDPLIAFVVDIETTFNSNESSVLS